jgi:adenosylhomocysteine nucleosidase
MERIGIIAAMELELRLIEKGMRGRRAESHAMFSFTEGTIGAAEVVLSVCGVGKVNAAACTQAMIDKFAVTAIINTGIAGAICDSLKPLDIVISSDVTYHDVRPARMSRLFPHQPFFAGDPELIALARKACTSLNLPGKCVAGRIVSGESFVNDDAEKMRIRDSYQACCVEMEGAAIGHVAYLNGIPFVIIRAISDRADSQADLTYQEFESIAAGTSAGIVLSMLGGVAKTAGRMQKSRDSNLCSGRISQD